MQCCQWLQKLYIQSILLSCNMGIPASKDPILQCFLSPLFAMHIHAPK